MYSFKQCVNDLVKLSTINFDKENILTQADYFGCSYQELTKAVTKAMAKELAWSQLKTDDRTELEKRFKNLNLWR